jgi:hypothetical protein
MRLVGPNKSNPNDIGDLDFASHSALGLNCQNSKQLCSWKACSLIAPHITKEALVGLTKFPRLKNKTAVAYTTIDESSGVAFSDSVTHINLWVYASANLPSKVTRVVQLDAYAKK